MSAESGLTSTEAVVILLFAMAFVLCGVLGAHACKAYLKRYGGDNR